MAASDKSKSMLLQVDEDVKNKIEETKNRIKISLDEYFQKGKKMEEEEIKAKIKNKRGGQPRKKKKIPA